MNLIICLHGILGGTKGKNGKGDTLQPKLLYEHISEQIIETNKDYFNKIDIVIHSWSHKQKDKILEEYKPTNYEIVEQKEFTKTGDNRKFSKLYSLFESIKLIEQVTDDDIIFSTRFDNFYKEKIVFEDINRYLIMNKVLFPGDPHNWSVYNDRRLQDLFFIAKYQVLKNVFTEKNYKNVTSLMKNKDSSCFCDNGGRQLDNHSIIRTVFEDNDIHRLDNYRSMDRKNRDKPYEVSTWRNYKKTG
tara:strand:- start:2685 stop:3419 length:735 start_codon:yes stop_codon:yes gene_type:complete